MVSYGTNAYGTHCGKNWSAMVHIHLRDILVICAQRDRKIPINCNMQL